MTIKNNIIYYEELSSKRTGWLFLGLTAFFLLLTVWRLKTGGWDGYTVSFLVFACFFLFYSVNYRVLIIRITPEAIKLTFGIFKWTVPFNNIQNCSIDEIPAFMKYGGAGIHFMFIEGRYRASFNFLEYPRVVIAFRNKVGPVQDISFSTRRPEEVLRNIRETMSA